MRSRIVHRDHRVPPELALDRGVPSFGVGRLNVLVDRALTDRRQGRGSRAHQRAEVVGIDRLGKLIIGENLDYTIVGWILDGVESDVAEVTLVADSITTTNAGRAIAEHVIGKANPRTPVLVIGLPEHAALGSQFNLAIANLVVLRGSWTEDKVGV